MYRYNVTKNKICMYIGKNLLLNTINTYINEFKKIQHGQVTILFKMAYRPLSMVMLEWYKGNYRKYYMQDKIY